MTGQEAAFALLKDELSPYAWDKIIRRELFENVRYPQIERAEDECALLDRYLRAQSVTIIDEPLYAYAVSAASLTWSRITPHLRLPACWSILRSSAAYEHVSSACRSGGADDCPGSCVPE